MSPGVSWQVVAILCSVIVALGVTCATIFVAIYRRMDARVGTLTNTLHRLDGARQEHVNRVEHGIRADVNKHAERMAAIEGHIKDVDEKYKHNVPELFKKWEDHCIDHPKGGQ